jgi:hypothetical protein
MDDGDAGPGKCELVPRDPGFSAPPGRREIVSRGPAAAWRATQTVSQEGQRGVPRWTPAMRDGLAQVGQVMSISGRIEPARGTLKGGHVLHRYWSPVVVNRA